MRNPISLHTHSTYSVLDGIGTVTEYLELCKKHGLTSLALTEHGNLCSTGELFTESKKYGIKPIYGIEAYLTKDATLRKRSKNYHVVLLAKNSIGFDNLLKINGFAQDKGFYYRPRIDMSVIKQYHEGLICTSACAAGRPAASKDPIKAINEFKEIFGDDYYLEFIPVEIPECIEINFKILQLAKQTNTKVVLTQDLHYPNKGGHELQDISFAIKQRCTLEELRKNDKFFKLSTTTLYYKTSDELLQFCKKYYSGHKDLLDKKRLEEMINMTWEIDAKIENVKIDTTPKLPKVDFDGQEGYAFLKNLIKKGLETRTLSADKQVYIDRIKTELALVKKYNMQDYFAIVADLVNYARKNGILTGPGRGSASSALILYLSGIGDLDPIKYGFIMERFISDSRLKTGEIPDVDLDVPDINRQQLIEYLYDKYGRDNVIPVGALGTFKFRMILKDLVRCYNLDYDEANIISKMLFTEFASFEIDELSMDEIIKLNTPGAQRLKAFLDNNPILQEKLTAFRGRLRHFTKHASGIVITHKKASDLIPVIRNKNELITGWVEGGRKRELTYFGLLKLDVLGLKNMTNINETLKLIKQTSGKQIDIRNLKTDDPKVLCEFTKGNTVGIFQFESDGIRRFLQQVRIDSFEDLMAVNALFRPGPLISGFAEMFIKNKINKRSLVYLPGTKSILKRTYNCLVYQEQLMQVVHELADFTMDETNDFRKNLLKRDAYIDEKRVKQLQEYRQTFVNRASKKIDIEAAEELFTQIEKFIEYGFNLPHATGYALIAYWCMYLKVYYPREFLTSILNSNIKNDEKTAKFSYTAKKSGIEILPPDVEKSDVLFKLEGEHSIRFPLTGVKKVGENAVKEIIAKRPFSSFDDFCAKITKRIVRKDCICNLLRVGAFKQFGKAKELFKNFAPQKFVEDDWDIKNLAFSEKQLLGFYLRFHPLDRFKINKEAVDTLITDRDIKPKHLNYFERDDVEPGQQIYALAVISNITTRFFQKNRAKKSGEHYKNSNEPVDERKGWKTTFIELDDGLYQKTAMVDSFCLKKYKQFLFPGNIIYFCATIDDKSRIRFNRGSKVKGVDEEVL